MPCFLGTYHTTEKEKVKGWSQKNKKENGCRVCAAAVVCLIYMAGVPDRAPTAGNRRCEDVKKRLRLLSEERLLPREVKTCVFVCH